MEIYIHRRRIEVKLPRGRGSQFPGIKKGPQRGYFCRRCARRVHLSYDDVGAEPEYDEPEETEEAEVSEAELAATFPDEEVPS